MTDHQLSLPYDAPFDERMAVFRARLDAVDPEGLDLSPTRWDRVATLLRAVHAHAGGEPGRYCQVAPERLQASAELTRSKLSRARGDAVRLGLLAYEKHYDRRSDIRSPDRLWVVHERVEELVVAGRCITAANASPSVNNRAQVRSPDPTRAQVCAYKETHVLTNSLSHSGRPSTGETKAEDRRPKTGGASRVPRPSPPVPPGKVSAPLPPPDRAAAVRFGRSVGKPRSRRDVELAWKLAALAPVLGEAWLAEVVAAVRTVRPGNPWAYAWRVACDGTRERPGPGERGLARLLARVPPPPDGWPRSERDLSERLCAAGRDEG